MNREHSLAARPGAPARRVARSAALAGLSLASLLGAGAVALSAALPSVALAQDAPDDPAPARPQRPVRDARPDPMPPVTPPPGAGAPGAGQLKAAPEARPDTRPADVTPLDDSTDARGRAYRDENMAKGDYYFKTGYYLKASEAYRVAVLAEPTNPWKKLAFGHALFAIGNYSYASYALRRAITQLDPEQGFNPDVGSLFPSKRAFEKAVKDLKRYVTYSPRDPAGLSVLGYMLYAEGEDERAKEMFVYLQRLPRNEQDPFAGYFLKQIGDRAGKSTTPALSPPRDVKPEVVTKKETPAAAIVPPEAARQEEEPATVKPTSGAALAE